MLTNEGLMTSDRELWACALHLCDTQGEEAIAFVADRVTAVARTGDEARIRIWLEIGEGIDAMRGHAERASR